MKEKITEYFNSLKEDGFLRMLVGIFLIFGTVYLIALGLVNTIFAERAIPNLKINGISVGGKTAPQIERLLDERVKDYKDETLIIKSEENKWEIPIKDLDPSYDYKKIAKDAINIGKNNVNLSPILGYEIKVEPKINGENFTKVSDDIREKENIPLKNAEITIEKETVAITDDKKGSKITDEEIRKGIITSVMEFKNEIILIIKITEPEVVKKDAENIKKQIEEFMNKPLVLKNNDKSFPINKVTLISWIDLKASIKRNSIIKEIYPSEEGDKKIIIELNKEEVEKKIKELSKQTNSSAQNAVLTIKDGRATVFVPSRTGQKLKEEESASKVVKEAPKEKEVTLVVEDIKPEVYEENLNDLGIKELVSSGNSNFKGSPNNRKHNIRVGASKFNGVLVKPDEIFSFNKYLGEVDAANGYLPELVILNDKTVPQYGGGLCQVSSTAFRAALNGGLPIVTRTSHAYPVKYYYPIGADATIYIPNPDLKFKNDTGRYVLVQTTMSGDTLKFDFYGTKPKRNITFSGNENGSGAVSKVEDVTPYLFNHDQKGKGSVDSIFYRFIYDENGKLANKYKNLSKYDSPEKYPKQQQ